MKKILLSLTVFLVIASPAFAVPRYDSNRSIDTGGGGSYQSGHSSGYNNSFETTSQMQQRHASERYEQRQAHGGYAPLGGYSEKLGDSYSDENPRM